MSLGKERLQAGVAQNRGEMRSIPYPNSVTADFRRASREQAFAAWREISKTGATA